jgi:hypothetical protein
MQNQRAQAMARAESPVFSSNDGGSGDDGGDGNNGDDSGGDSSDGDGDDIEPSQ